MENIIASVISFFSLVASFYAVYLTQKTFKTGLMPILVFSRRTNGNWQIENVGNGPAINVVIADGTKTRDWVSIVRCFPIAAGAKVELTWLVSAYELAAVYFDSEGEVFTSKCCSNENSICKGNKYPAWDPTIDQGYLEILRQATYTEEELKEKTPIELDHLRNEIFAKYGYVFKREDLKEYFQKQEWYKPKVNDQWAVFRKMTPEEKGNTYLIVDFQKRNNLRTKESEGDKSKRENIAE